MMRNLFLIIITVCIYNSNGFSQTAAEIKYNKEHYEEKSNEIKAQLISDIIEALNVDDFEKQIVTQSIESYFVEVTKIYVLDLPAFEKQDLVTQLEGRHFNDIKTIITQEQIDFILNQIKGDWKKNQKKKKRKKRKKNKDN